MVSKLFDHRLVPFSALTKEAVILIFGPSFLTFPSRIYLTPSSLPISFGDLFLSLYEKLALLETTTNFLYLERADVRSSDNPSQKYSCSSSLLKFLNNITAREPASAFSTFITGFSSEC